LRYSPALDNEKLWNQIVHDGALQTQGMVSFAPVLSREDIASVRAYVIARANEDEKRRK
jgi:hypothetical protein